MRVLGIDFGEKQTGVSISDELNTIAMPHCVIYSDRVDPVEEIRKIVFRHKVGRVVVGMPFNMSGTRGKRAIATEEFIGRLRESVNVEVIEWDERLSTRFSERILNNAGVKGRRNKKKAIDKISAVFILQGYLDYLRHEAF